jgi:hypothetical protein
MGVPLPAVSKRLGHANVHVNATVYSHALPHDEVAAAQLWNEAMSGTVQATPVQPGQKRKAKRAVVSIESGKKSAQKTAGMRHGCIWLRELKFTQPNV